jgi:hypothetical protein
LFGVFLVFLQIEMAWACQKHKKRAFLPANFVKTTSMAYREDNSQQPSRWNKPSQRNINFDESDNERDTFDARYPLDEDDSQNYQPRNRRDSYYPEDDDAEDYNSRRQPRRRQQPRDDYNDDYRNERNSYRESSRDDYRDDDYRENSRDGYRSGYRDGFRDNNHQRNYSDQRDNRMDSTPKKQNFRQRHPIFMNLLYAILAAFLLIWIALWFLDFWTFHGQERAVPDVKGQSFEIAQDNISHAGLRAIVTDSVYDSYARPGTVVEQIPIPSAKIKKGGAVYLTLVAYTPKMVTIPDFYDVSERQARSMLEGLGIHQVLTVTVPSEYSGLVLGTKFNGVSLRPGAKVPVTAVITLEVGGGMDALEADGELVDSAAIEQVIDALNID